MYNIENIKNTIIQGNCMEILKNIPSNSVDMVFTSSPYFGLRSYDTKPVIWDNDNGCDHNWVYSTKKGISGGIKSEKVGIKGVDNFQIVPDTEYGFCSKCNSWKGELGQEPHHNLFIEHLSMIFMECARVVKETGTLWFNIADSYTGNASLPGSDKQMTNRGTRFVQKNKGDLGLKNKTLIGIPERLKISLIDKGLINRNTIIWRKPNQMPSSSKDRFTNDYEFIYFFVKNKKYYFEQQLEPSLWAEKDKRSVTGATKGQKTSEGIYAQQSNGTYRKDGMRNIRTVWDINTRPNKETHFASYPQELLTVPIKSGCPVGGIVLDPFFGSGTTGIAARDLNRNYIGLELNPEYIGIANKRLGL